MRLMSVSNLPLAVDSTAGYDTWGNMRKYTLSSVAYELNFNTENRLASVKVGTAQPTVLLIPTGQLAAKRPAAGGALVSILGDGLVATPLVPQTRALGFGRALAGNVDVDGDGKRDLVVSATGANVNGDGTGAVFIFKGGTVTAGPNRPAMVIVADHHERGAFGQDLSLSAAAGTSPAAPGIGAPTSYRTGTSNGTAFVLPLA